MKNNQKHIFIGIIIFCVVFVFLHVVMLFIGDPIVDYQAKSAADSYVREKYPHQGYEFDLASFESLDNTYTFYYLRKDDESAPELAVNVTPDNNIPVVRYFSSFSIDESFDYPNND